MSARAATGNLRDLFLDMIATERNASRNTLDAYRRDLDGYAEFLAGRKSDFAKADTQTIRNYLSALAARELAAASVARKLSAIRQLHRFLYTEGLRKDDPAAVLEGPKRGRPLPKIMTVAEVTKLLAAAHELAAENGDSKNAAARRLRALRLAALLELLYASGLRVSELIALPASAARTKNSAIIVRGKGNKERLVPIGNAALRAMKAYLDARGDVGKAAERRWLFPSFGESGHVTRQHVARELKALAARAGSRRERSARMCCAMPLRAICSRMARISGSCRRSWVMPTSPPRRSTRMFWTNASGTWFAICIRWRGNSPVAATSLDLKGCLMQLPPDLQGPRPRSLEP